VIDEFRLELGQDSHVLLDGKAVLGVTRLERAKGLAYQLARKFDESQRAPSRRVHEQLAPEEELAPRLIATIVVKKITVVRNLPFRTSSTIEQFILTLPSKQAGCNANVEVRPGI
jgi:hypothetical protein